MRLLRALVLLAMAAAALASAEAWAAETSDANVTLTVRVYRNPAGREVAFDRDLDKANVLALQVAAHNNAERELIVRRTDMTLRLDSGREVGAISAKQAALRADAGPDVAGVMAGTFFLGYAGAVLAGHAEDTARSEQINNYDARELKDIALAPSESVEGYVFFHLASGVAAAQDGELLVRLVDSASGAVSIVPLPLKDVGGAPVETPEPESRLVREDGRDTAHQQANQAPPEPQVEVVGEISKVVVPAPDPATAQPSATIKPATVTPMVGTPLSAPAPVEPAVEEVESEAPPLAGPSTRP